MTTETLPDALTWSFGDWTLQAGPGTDGSVIIHATRYARRSGSWHGRYALLPQGDVVTISMASTKVNAHMQTLKVRRMLADYRNAL